MEISLKLNKQEIRCLKSVIEYAQGNDAWEIFDRDLKWQGLKILAKVYDKLHQS